MLNTAAYIVLAGNPEPWDEETRQRCRPGVYSGTYDSNDLCTVQVDQHRRGRRSAHLVPTIYGWSVRYASGLDGNSILFGGRMLGRQVSFEEAVEWGKSWANADPDNREFYAHKAHLDQPEVEAAP